MRQTIADFTCVATMTMHPAMDAQATYRRIDAALHLTGLIARGLGYAVVAAFAQRYECGQAILTGLFVGDLFATLIGTALHGRERLVPAVGELGVLGLVYLLAHTQLTWSDDTATRGIIGLAALGVIATRTGGDLLTRVGADDPYS